MSSNYLDPTYVVQRDTFSPFETKIAQLSADFKTSVEGLASLQSGVSTAQLIKLQYDQGFLSMLVDVSASLVSTLKDTTKTITQKI